MEIMLALAHPLRRIHNPDPMMLKRTISSIIKKLGYTIQRNETIKTLRDVVDKIDGMTSEEELSYLHKLASTAKDGCIIEVGSYRGRSTAAIALGAKNGSNSPVFAIEPHEIFEGVLGGNFGPPDRKAFYLAMLNSGGFENVRLINLSSEQVTPGWNQKVAMLWIDGDHSYDGVKRDFECWRPHLGLNADIIFDDSLDPASGPGTLIKELLESRMVELVTVVGKITHVSLLG